MSGNVEIGVGTACNTVVVCQTGTGTFLYVANFSDGTVDVFDHRYEQVSSFTDLSLPRGYAPFDLQLIDGSLFVTFVHHDAVHRDDFAEPEHGFIAEFNPDGIMLGHAEFRSGRRYDAGWHRQMPGRVASNEFRKAGSRF